MIACVVSLPEDLFQFVNNVTTLSNFILYVLGCGHRFRCFFFIILFVSHFILHFMEASSTVDDGDSHDRRRRRQCTYSLPNHEKLKKRDKLVNAIFLVCLRERAMCTANLPQSIVNVIVDYYQEKHNSIRNCSGARHGGDVTDRWENLPFQSTNILLIAPSQLVCDCRMSTELRMRAICVGELFETNRKKQFTKEKL